MKTFKYFIILPLVFAFIGCKNESKNDEDGLVTEHEFGLLPNESDIKFFEALKFMQNGQNSEAAKSIKDGINEINKESKTNEGFDSKNFEATIAQLNKVAADLENGTNVQINKVKKLMSTVEIEVHHSYLGTDDVYFVDDVKSPNPEEAHTRLGSTIASLKTEDGKVKGDLKKEYDSLVSEGKRLEDDFQSWNKRTVEYDKRVIEHKQKQIPQ